MGKLKGYNSSHVYCQAKGWSKGAKKTFSMILKRVFEMVWWGGENGIMSKRIFEVEVFFSSQNINFPFYLRRLLELFSFSFSFFFFFLFPFFYAPSLKDLGVFMIFEDKITSSKTSFQMTWHGMAWLWLWIYCGGRKFQNGVVLANIAKP
jgi:hypothetical protein